MAEGRDPSPFVTVLIPSHNRGAALERAVRSVLAQSYTNFELFVVLDGCTDDSAARMEALVDQRVRVFDLPKAPGYGHANRALALKEASGELFAYQQDDDLWFYDHLERLVRLNAGRKLGWVHSRSFWIHEKGLILPHYANATIGMARSRLENRANMIASSMVMHPAGLLEAAGGWDVSGEPGGDWRLWQNMLKQDVAWPPRCQIVPSVLHINSRFKESPNWPSFLSKITDLSKRNIWPKALRLPEHEDRQAQLWEMMEADPVGFARSLRHGFATLEQNILWGFSLGKL